MKLESNRVLTEESSAGLNTVELPHGLLGFEELQQVELVYAEDQLPFMWLRDTGSTGIEFLVVQPYGLISDYEVEISGLDVEELELSSPDEVLILNIVTVHDEGARLTANLVGPVVVNRRTRRGRQIVLANHQDYSARHLLYDESPVGVEAKEG